MLQTLTDFLEFKQMFLNYKAVSRLLTVCLNVPLCDLCFYFLLGTEIRQDLTVNLTMATTEYGNPGKMSIFKKVIENLQALREYGENTYKSGNYFWVTFDNKHPCSKMGVVTKAWLLIHVAL